MAKLCYKVNGTVKKYDLKDSVTGSPKLGVKVGGSTKYLGLKQGTKSGEINVKVGGQSYYVQRLKEPEDATPMYAPFYFGINHVHQNIEWGKPFISNETPTEVEVPNYLGWAEDNNSKGGQVYTTPQYVTSEHEYAYLPSDNSKGTYAESTRGFIDTAGHYGWYMLYSHRHGRTIWVAKIRINDVEEAPNVERRIHVGDKIAIYFENNRDYGNGSDNYGSWSYWCRPVLRRLDD